MKARQKGTKTREVCTRTHTRWHAHKQSHNTYTRVCVCVCVCVCVRERERETDRERDREGLQSIATEEGSARLAPLQTHTHFDFFPFFGFRHSAWPHCQLRARHLLHSPLLSASEQDRGDLCLLRCGVFVSILDIAWEERRQNVQKQSWRRHAQNPTRPGRAWKEETLS